MGPSNLIRHPLVFTGITVPEFLLWYFWEQPRDIMRSYIAYCRAFFEIFSFVFLLRTLFAPWKQIRSAYPHRGFNLGAISQALTLNILSRTIGFFLRLITLIGGVVFMMLLTAVFTVFFMLWVTFPVLFWICVSYVITALL